MQLMLSNLPRSCTKWALHRPVETDVYAAASHTASVVFCYVKRTELLSHVRQHNSSNDHPVLTETVPLKLRNN